MNRFRSARSAEEEQTLKKSDAAKYKIRNKVGFEDFLFLRSARKVKEVKIDDAGHETDDIGLIQTLTIHRWRR
jgi:hypothetical protein